MLIRFTDGDDAVGVRGHPADVAAFEPGGAHRPGISLTMGPAKHIAGLIDSVPGPCKSEQGIVIGVSAADETGQITGTAWRGLRRK